MYAARGHAGDIWAKQNGVFTGDSAGNFGWQQPITREAAAKLLYEYHRMQKE